MPSGVTVVFQMDLTNKHVELLKPFEELFSFQTTLFQSKLMYEYKQILQKAI